jgi:N-acetylglutamate synthase-like GNAT family acetyltransferase
MRAHRLEIITNHDLSASDIGVLEDHLDEFNSNRTGCHDSAMLSFELKLDDALIGGIAGFTWAGFCELRQFWIHERFRGAGHGTELLNRAIDEARARNCSHIYLATYSFQAPNFYKRFGFETVAVVEDRPPGHRDFIMRLVLQPNLRSPGSECDQNGR